MRAAERFTAVTGPSMAVFSGAAVHARLISAGVNPHSCQLGTETTQNRVEDQFAERMNS